MKSMQSIRTILVKELREFVRDKRTLMLALVLGPLLTPAIMLGILTLAETRAKSQIEKPLDVPMVGVEHAPNLVKWLAGQGIHRKPFEGDLDTAIRTQVEDVYLRIGDNFGKDWHAGSPALVEIVHDRDVDDRQDEERIARGEIVDPQRPRRVAQFDGFREHPIQREEDRHLDQQRQAARGRVDLFLLVQLHRRHLQLLAVVAVEIGRAHV